jgi:two-component system sensor histidine kinase YesM
MGRIIVMGVPYYDANQKTYESNSATEKIILKEIDKLKRGDIPDWLIQSVKAEFAQNIALQFEESDQKTMTLVQCFIYDIPTDRIFTENAQIQALQSRINPHFLNNALETINWEARMEGSETIENMISALSVLLNASLGRKNRRLVSLQEELEVADSYIFFIQQRFGDSLTITRVIDPDAEDCIVPLLTVQPVLENAVEHGIAPAGGGEIRLSARQAANCLELKITNTGQFLRPEDRQRIDAALSGEAGEGNHLGLANIANRLRLLYGSQARLTISGGPGEETVVEIHVPQTAEEDPEGNQMIACQKKKENRND